MTSGAKWWQRRSVLLGLLAVMTMGIGLRVAYLQSYLQSTPYLHAPAAEAAHQRALAEEVANGYLVGPEFLPHDPLYPVWLGGIYRLGGTQLRWVTLVQSLMGLLSLFLVFLLGRRIASAEVGVLAAGLCALYGPLLFFETKLLGVTISVLIYLLCLVVGLWAITRKSPLWSVLAGVTLGLLCWARPWLLLFPLAVAVLGLIRLWRDAAVERHQHLLRGAWALVGLGLVLTPLHLRNAWAGAPGRILPTSLGLRFYAGNNPMARGTDQAPPGFHGPRASWLDQGRFQAARALDRRTLSHAEASRYYRDLGLRWLASNPGTAARLLVTKSYRLSMAHEPRGAYSFECEREQQRTLTLAPIPFSLLFVLGLGGLIFIGRLRHRAWLWASVVAHVLFMVIVSVNAESRVTLAPILSVPAAAALYALVRARGWRPTVLAIGALALSAALMFNPLDDRQTLRSEEWLQQGQTLLRQGRPYAARFALARALAARPEDHRVHLALGRAEMQLERPKAAVDHFRRVITAAPRQSDGHVELAIAAHQLARRYLASGDRGAGADWLHQAGAHFEKALALSSTDVNALVAFATLKRELGRLTEADGLLARAWRETPNRGEVHVQLGIQAAIRKDLATARAHFTAAQLLGTALDPEWEKALREAEKSRQTKAGAPSPKRTQ